MAKMGGAGARLTKSKVWIISFIYLAVNEIVINRQPPFHFYTI